VPRFFARTSFFRGPFTAFLLPFTRFLFVLVSFLLTLFRFLLLEFFALLYFLPLQFVVLLRFFVALTSGFLRLFSARLSFVFTFFDCLFTLPLCAFGGFSPFSNSLGFRFASLPFAFYRPAWTFLFVPTPRRQARAKLVPIKMPTCVANF
jgi:hypothetical protein